MLSQSHRTTKRSFVRYLYVENRANDGGEAARGHEGEKGAFVPVCDYKSCRLVNGAIHHILVGVWGEDGGCIIVSVILT